MINLGTNDQLGKEYLPEKILREKEKDQLGSNKRKKLLHKLTQKET